jgi:hypothetical protein
MNGNHKEYEELTHVSSFWSWVFLIVFSAIILGWGMFVEKMVTTAPPQWDFGVLPDTPSQSVYSTILPPVEEVNIPYQMTRIPDANLPPGEIKQ